MSGRVPEGSGGSSRVQEGLEFWEGPEGSGRVSVGPEVSEWVKKGPQGSGEVQRIHKVPGGS